VDGKLAGATVSCLECGLDVGIPRPEISAGVDLGGFILEKQLGFGAMGEVWLAKQETMDRKVALKLLSREHALDSEFVERFLKEARISAKMDHSNIITAFDAGCDKDIYYLAITFVDGCTLEDRMATDGAIPEKEALTIALAISEALCYAWNEFKIIHRDIKPGNIMIDKKGCAKLMDMGISKSANDNSSLTMSGSIIGTPHYISPEQGTGEKNLDFRSDIYSLGATLYHIVTGVLPFEAETPMGVVSKHITEPLTPPRRKNRELSLQCSHLIESMMEKERDKRQKSWEDVVKDVQSVLAGEFPPSKPKPLSGVSIVTPMAGSLSSVAETKTVSANNPENSRKASQTATNSRKPASVDDARAKTNLDLEAVKPPPTTLRHNAKKTNSKRLLAFSCVMILIVPLALFLVFRLTSPQILEKALLLPSDSRRTQDGRDTNNKKAPPQRMRRYREVAVAMVAGKWMAASELLQKIKPPSARAKELNAVLNELIGVSESRTHEGRGKQTELSASAVLALKVSRLIKKGKRAKAVVLLDECPSPFARFLKSGLDDSYPGR
jgi:serine/threonine-protein kinase